MLEQLLFLLAPAGIIAAALLRFLLPNYWRLRGWREAAKMGGLEVLATSIWGPQLTARTESSTVTFEALGSATRIVLRMPVPPSLYTVSIRRESVLRRGLEIEVGDPSFDKTFFIEGPERPVLSLLNAEMRRLLSQTDGASRLQISTGMLQADVSEKMAPFL
ncbi:MAG: hypothetical protein ABUL63_04165, partial [Acidobacteriota bacterium]